MCLGPSWILIRILHGSEYGSYMDLCVDLIWVVYMLMCSQLIQNVNISLEICANVSGGLWRNPGEQRATVGEGSGKVPVKVRGMFGEGSGKVRGTLGGASARPPCGNFYGTLIILLLKPSSEFAIRETLSAKHPNNRCGGAAGAQLWKASWSPCGAHLVIKAGFRHSCLASWEACGQQSPCPRQNARCALCARMTS